MFDNSVATNSWNQMATTPSASNCYQNYAGYYSNIDYFNSTAQQQLASFNIEFPKRIFLIFSFLLQHENALENSWMKREENWFYNNAAWSNDAQRK